MKKLKMMQIKLSLSNKMSRWDMKWTKDRKSQEPRTSSRWSNSSKLKHKSRNSKSSLKNKIKPDSKLTKECKEKPNNSQSTKKKSHVWKLKKENLSIAFKILKCWRMQRTRSSSRRLTTQTWLLRRPVPSALPVKKEGASLLPSRELEDETPETTV